MAHSWDSLRKVASLTTFSPAEPLEEGPQTSLPVSSLLAKLLPFSLPVTALRGQWGCVPLVGKGGFSWPPQATAGNHLSPNTPVPLVFSNDF